MKRVRSVKPFWHLTGAQLRPFKTKDGVFMLSGLQCQLVFVDLGDPIAISIQKPYRLQKEENVITGVFMLNPGAVKSGAKPYYIVAPYRAASKAFVFDIESGEVLQAVMKDTTMRQLLGEERERTRKALAA